MRVEKRESGDERRILIGMIVDRTVLGEIATRWNGRLFRSKWSNLVGDWCVEFYRKHGKAPGPIVESLYEHWAERTPDKEAAPLIERFLASLSEQYAQLRRDSNSSYVMDLAGRYFNRVRLERLQQDLQKHLEAGDLERAEKSLDAARRTIDIGVGAGIDVLHNQEAIKRALDMAKEPPLVTYPGPLGEFFAELGLMSRENFIAFLAPEKRGKCISEDMEVLLADGSLKTIAEIVADKITTPILALNEETQRLEPMPISQWWDNGKKECWEVTTRTGRRVVTTANHQYLTPDGWRYLQDIRIGSCIAVPKKMEVFGREQVSDASVKFLSYMLAEGGCTATQPSFTNTDPELTRDFESSCDALGIQYRRKGITYHLIGSTQVVREFGMMGCSAKTKRIPDWLFRCPKSQISLFLRIFFSCDGSIHQDGSGPRIELTLANEKMLRQISHLLLRFGIVHLLRFKPATFQGRRFPAWRIVIGSQEYVQLFLKEIGFLSYKHREAVQVEKSRSFLDKLPPAAARRAYNDMKQEFSSIGFYRRFGRKRAKAVLDQLRKDKPLMRQSFSHMKGTESYRKHLESDVLWDEVVSIRCVGERQTYDLSVPIHHNFVASDCIVHNTFWLLDLAWRAMEQRRKVAFFEVGDMSEPQIMQRFLVRAAKRPLHPRVVKYPRAITREPGESMAEVVLEERPFEKGLDWQTAWNACQKIMKTKVKSKRSFLKLSCHPNSSVGVSNLESILAVWEREDWTPDVICIDYADLLLPPPNLEGRDAINETWKRLRGLSQSLHCLVATATQANAAAYRTDTISMANFSEDKRKNAHVTAMIGLNATAEEKERGITRINLAALREGEYSEQRCVHVAGCLSLANPAICSTF